jgi:5,6-dimethylbenzimidazole synthase
MTRHAFPATWRRGVYEAIARRRDMRHFLADPIPPETLARILWAAHQAGSVGFSQPWNFLIVEKRELRERVRAHVDAERLRAAETFTGERREKYLAFKLEGILEAPINLCVTCDRERFGPAIIGRNTIPETDVYSTCGAIQNLWLAARSEGIGVGWVSILQPETLRNILGIPEGIVPVAYLCIGFVESFPDRPMLETAGWLPRLPLRAVVYQDRWGERPSAELSHALETLGTVDEEPKNTDPPRKGLLLVYTGHGKGKTTAALGIVFRALGRGLRVAVVQFIKGKWKTGERLFADGIPGLTFLVMGQGFTWESDDLSRDRDAADAAWRCSKELICSGENAVVILDEITYAIHYGFISLEDVLSTLRDRPSHVNVVVTGRNAPEELCTLADLVTEMKPIKHPFEKGMKAQLGIDF